ncbi:MAG: BatD family protein [Opitutaceae bacterium]
MRRIISQFFPALVAICSRAIARSAGRQLVPATLLIFLAVTSPTLAQSVRWDPPGGQLGFNQVSPISLTFENCEPDGDPRLPKMDGLTFGQPSQSTETSVVNFHVTSHFSLTFPVRPTKRTTVVIPAFEIKTDKGNLRVNAATFTVGDATVGNAGTGPALDEVASAKLTTPKNNFWVGEVFPITYNLNVVRRYFHSLATNVEWLAAPLVAEDWSKPDPSEMLIRGERRVVSTQTTRAYAKQPGLNTLKPATQMVNLMVGTTGFGLFSQATVEQRALQSSPQDITIQALPPSPAHFSGAVGQFTFTSKVVPTSAAVGEPVTWTIELAGVGNWPDITGLPSREVSNEFQVVQPKSKRTMKEGALFEGGLSEDVVLVPSHPGSYKLKPVHFTYFDPQAGSYKTITSEPVTLTITTGATEAPTRSNPGAPVQFSINPAVVATPTMPTATPPVPPENLPRDPLAGSPKGGVPFRPDYFWMVAAAPAAGIVLIAWLILAALRSRATDPQRHRRQARAQLAAALADLRKTNGPLPDSTALRTWQQQAAALWEIPHAAPGTPLLQACIVAHAQGGAAAPDWASLWIEADRALHSREPGLPADWLTRAETALQKIRVPGWAPFSLFGLRNLLPFVFSFTLLFVPLAAQADSATDAYKQGNFTAAETGWRHTIASTPNDWSVRHNLGLALGQQDRWAEATAHWTSAFLLNSRAEITRWDLTLGLQRSGLAPAELVNLARGEGRSRLARYATPAEWQLSLIGAALLLAAALIGLLLQGYQRIGAWAKPAALTASLLAVLLAAAATLSLHTYGPLAHPEVTFVWQASVLRSIPTEADTTQKTSPLSAGSIAVAEKTFLGWTKLNFPGGQTGWVRTTDLISLYR